MGSKIKIVHIVQSPGGVERYIRAFLKYIDRDRFENILICSYDYIETNYSDLTEGFTNVDMVRSIKLSKDLSAIYVIRRYLKMYKPDIVYCHSSKAGMIGRIANFGLKTCCIYNPHGWAFNMRGSKIKQYIYTIAEKCLALFCKKIICISEAEKKSALIKKICSEQQIRVIYNGIDFDEFQNSGYALTRKELGIADDAFVIGMVGRLSEQKAPDIFVKAAKKIKQRISNAFFLMVGDGEERIEIENLIKEYGLSKLFLITGWVDNPMDYIKIFDVATLFSRWEGFGLVLPEYMLAGKPIVATDVDAIPYIIKNNINGLLVAQDDYLAAAEGVVDLFKQPKLATSLKNCALSDVYNKYDVKRVIDEHEKLFEELFVKERRY